MPGMTRIRLPHTDTTWPLGGLGTPNCKENEKTILESYNTLNHASKKGKVPTTAVDNMRSNWIGYILGTLD